MTGLFWFAERMASDGEGRFRIETGGEIVEGPDARCAVCKSGECSKQRLGAKFFDPGSEAGSFAREGETAAMNETSGSDHEVECHVAWRNRMPAAVGATLRDRVGTKPG